MQIQDRIDLFTKLGAYIEDRPEVLEGAVQKAYYENRWFAPAQVWESLDAIRAGFLKPEKLSEWANHYALSNPVDEKTIGLVLAGNIPLVGFHDVLCVLIAGHRAKVKLSDKDRVLIPFLMKKLTEWDERINAYFDFVPQLQGFDAIIATGSTNTSRYFEHYFNKYPHIIRKNRHAIGILTGNESVNQLQDLSEDIFKYFGLGCRNVSKIYIPDQFQFEPLLETLHERNDVILHNKYKNNYDYNTALFLLNSEPYLATGAVLLREDTSLHSRIATLHYEYYQSLSDLQSKLNAQEEQIQLIVSSMEIPGFETFNFGAAQHPGLMDYADGVDVIQWLLGL